MSELEDLKRKISIGMKRYFKTEEGKKHKERLSRVMKKRWEELKKEEIDEIDDVNIGNRERGDM
jgi:hypothetical protein